MLQLTYLTTIAMEIEMKNSESAILEAYLAISGNELLVKINSKRRRDWTSIRKITDKEKTIKALRTLNSQYEDGIVMFPYEVLNEYDKLVS